MRNYISLKAVGTLKTLTEARHEKTNILVSDLVPHKSGCTATDMIELSFCSKMYKLFLKL